jgi:hypothetical protein
MVLTYAKLARDLKEGTKLSATFDDAVAQHRMIRTIETSPKLGQQEGDIG